jgi:membrane-associated phospholipid phosphatase
MYLGVHYPSDVFCGAILGVLMGWAFLRIYVRLNHSFFKKPVGEDSFKVV